MNRRTLRALRSVPWWSWVAALVVGVLALLAIAIRVESPADWWMEPPDSDGDRETKTWASWLGQTGALLAAVTAMGAPIKGAVSRFSDRRQLEDAAAAARLTDVAKAIFNVLVDKLGNDAVLWQKSTVRIMVVDRRGEQPLLTRAAELQNHERTPSGITWIRGKGLGGAAWQEGKIIHLNVRDPQYLDAASSRAKWDAYGERRGLNFDEVRRLTNQPYGAVAAFPVYGRVMTSVVCGVVTIDIPDGYFDRLRDPALTRLLELFVKAADQEVEMLFDHWEV